MSQLQLHGECHLHSSTAIASEKTTGPAFEATLFQLTLETPQKTSPDKYSQAICSNRRYSQTHA